MQHHEDGYVAYPVGLKGIVIGEGNTVDEALKDVRSAIAFHLQTFGNEAFQDAPSEVVLADLELAV